MSTAIEWTNEVWNPVVGCSRTSPGCDRCYAIGVAHRAMQPAHAGLTIKVPGERVDWTGEVRCLPERLDMPQRWRSPRLVFVNSMSDLFHPDVPTSFIVEVFEVMRSTPQHTYQVLTKRSHRMLEVLNHPCWDGPPANAWMGVSVESPKYAFRIRHLRAVGAAVRFISAEPLLGPLDLDDDDHGGLHGIDWVIAGGESGPGARPMHPDWARDLRDQCVAAGVPFFFKQHGAYVEVEHLDEAHTVIGTHGPAAYLGTGRHARLRRVGKKAAGRVLDGRTWDEMPAAAR